MKKLLFSLLIVSSLAASVFAGKQKEAGREDNLKNLLERALVCAEKSGKTSCAEKIKEVIADIENQENQNVIPSEPENRVSQKEAEAFQDSLDRAVRADDFDLMKRRLNDKANKKFMDKAFFEGLRKYQDWACDFTNNPNRFPILSYVAQFVKERCPEVSSGFLFAMMEK